MSWREACSEIADGWRRGWREGYPKYERRHEMKHWLRCCVAAALVYGAWNFAFDSRSWSLTDICVALTFMAWQTRALALSDPRRHASDDEPGAGDA